MTDVQEPNDDIEPDEPEYKPTRGTLAHEDDSEHEQGDAPEHEDAAD